MSAVPATPSTTVAIMTSSSTTPRSACRTWRRTQRLPSEGIDPVAEAAAVRQKSHDPSAIAGDGHRASGPNRLGAGAPPDIHPVRLGRPPKAADRKDAHRTDEPQPDQPAHHIHHRAPDPA